MFYTTCFNHKEEPNRFCRSLCSCIIVDLHRNITFFVLWLALWFYFCALQTLLSFSETVTNMYHNCRVCVESKFFSFTFDVVTFFCNVCKFFEHRLIGISPCTFQFNLAILVDKFTQSNHEMRITLAVQFDFSLSNNHFSHFATHFDHHSHATNVLSFAKWWYAWNCNCNSTWYTTQFARQKSYDERYIHFRHFHG